MNQKDLQPQSAKVLTDYFSDYKITILINLNNFFRRFIFKMQITQRLFSYSLRILSLRLHSLICPFGCVGSAESLFRFLFTHCLLAGMPVYLSLSHSHTPSRYYINIMYREL